MIDGRAINLQERLDQAVARLMFSNVQGDRAQITVPVLFPSGARACVEILLNDGNCFVTDLGFGQTEAEMYGAMDFYDPAVRLAASKFGVGYDGFSVFAAWAAIDNIERAIGAVANASVSAAANATMRAAEGRERRIDVDLFARVVGIFGPHKVARSMELSGKEDTWPAHNVVSLPNGRRAVFEFVSDSPISVSSKFLMFSDLSRRKGEFSLTSVVADISKVKGKRAMLADVSRIIEIGAPESDFRKFAEAA